MQTLLFSLTFLLLFSGCQERGYGTQDIDTIPSVLSTEAPKLLSSTPKSNGAIAQRAYINVVFNTILDADTVSTKTVQLKSGKTVLDIELTIINNLVYIKPMESLKDKVNYSLTFSDNITDFFGNALDKPYTLKFHCQTDFWESVEAGQKHAIAKSKAGDLYMWGSNRKQSLLVDPILYSVDMPFPVAGQDDVQVFSAGTDTSALINTSNTLITIGNIKLSDPLESVDAVSIGAAHSVLVYDNRTLYSWGSNESSALGSFNLQGSQSPVQEYSKSENWQSASAGQNFTLAIQTDGTLWGWGANDKGQLAIELRNELHRPTLIDNRVLRWASVSSGQQHALAIESNGSLWSWGNNASGELGHGDNQNSREVKMVKSTQSWKAVSAGTDHSLALDLNGTLWAWGSNQSGQLGIDVNSTKNKNTPVKVNGITPSPWISMSAGDRFSLGVKKDGTLWAWGVNDKGQLGLGQTEDLLIRTEVK